MQNIVSLAALGKLDNIANNDEQVKLADIDSLNPGEAGGSVFQNILHKAIDPINSAENSVAANLHNLQNNTNTPVDPAQLVAIQTSSNQLFVQSTLVSKGVNMTVKAVNELTHTQ